MTGTLKGAFGAGVAAAALLAGLAAAQAGTLKIESWRNDDADIWNSKIIPAFNKHYPDIKVEFSPSAPKEYNAALNARLAGGTAGDLITCRPFDASLDSLQEAPARRRSTTSRAWTNFSDVAKAAWQTDDGKTTFCVPMASVIHGFIYNKDAFEEGRRRPSRRRWRSSTPLLDKLKKDGTYTPHRAWAPPTSGKPRPWASRTSARTTGRARPAATALIAGKEKFTDPQYVAVFKELASWAPYMGNGYQAQNYPDSQNLFSLGKGAIYPAGSWDISTFRGQAKFPMGAFPPPLPAGDKRLLHLRPHRHRAWASTRPRRTRTTPRNSSNGWRRRNSRRSTPTRCPASSRSSKRPVKIKDDLAATMVGWRKDCKSTIRNSYQILSRGTPNLENELWNVSAQVINGTLTPDAAAKQLQDGLDKWYKPAK